MNRRDLMRRRKRILARMASIDRLRRGQVSEQYYRRANKYGGTSRYGPYYIWQRWIDGRKKSDRIWGEDLKTIRQHTENYRQLKDLFDELVEVTEQLTLLER